MPFDHLGFWKRLILAPSNINVVPPFNRTRLQNQDRDRTGRAHVKAIQEFAEATAACVGGVGCLSQRESGLERSKEKKKKKEKAENNCSSVNRDGKKIRLKNPNLLKRRQKFHQAGRAVTKNRTVKQTKQE